MILSALYVVARAGLNATEDTVPDIEAAANLRVAAIATLCHAMSLENILAYLTAILLEKQVSGIFFNSQRRVLFDFIVLNQFADCCVLSQYLHIVKRRTCNHAFDATVSMA